MRAHRLGECLEIIRWSPPTLAHSLKVDPATVESWMSGEAEIPVNVGSWVEALCFTHEASDLMRPTVEPAAFHKDRTAGPRRIEHIPTYAYGLLRKLAEGPVLLHGLFGTDDEAAVFFLVSRGLAERTENQLVITHEGVELGGVLVP